MHFIGIGGVGMSGIAEILINLGYEVSGSDLKKSVITEKLRSKGAKIYIGHSADNIKDYNVVVTSSAIDLNNPEIIESKKRKISIIHRSEMLAELVRLKHGIGVAGTHGKTTTSSILSWLLSFGDLNPTAVIGGEVLNFGSNARVGEGEYIVFEADESDGTFLNLLPSIGIVTNIDADHLDHYKYFENIKRAFLEYINNIPFYGYSVLCLDDYSIKELLPEIERPFYTYGFSLEADFRASDVEVADGYTKFKCFYQNNFLGDFRTSLLGNHNVLNSLGAIAVAFELGLSVEKIQKGLDFFQGVGRRIEKIGEEKEILVVDDYGHHPTEIRETLSALKKMGRRLLVIFQPHRYSRTKLLCDEFGQSFSEADLLFLTEIYPAGEIQPLGVSASLLKKAIKKHGKREVPIIKKGQDIAKEVLAEARRGDLILTLGAGDIYKQGQILIEEIKKIDIKS
jgi:UDP-N-acetylmuramate--alanine ligase